MQVLISIFLGITLYQMPRFIFLLVLGLYVVLACFRAWREAVKIMQEAQKETATVKEELKETKHYLLLESSNNTPNFKGSEIEQTASGSNPEMNLAFLVLLVNLRNTGATSCADGWGLSIKSDELNLINVRPKEVPGTLLIPIGAEEFITLRKDEMIYEKAAKPVERGASLRGYLYYELPNVTAEQIRSDGTILRLQVIDINMKLYEIPFEGSKENFKQPRYFPGTSHLVHTIQPIIQPQNSNSNKYARSLSQSNRLRILEYLKDKPKGKVTLLSQAGDIEAYGYAKELEGVLRTAGWSVIDIGQGRLVPPAYGVLLTVRDELALPVVRLKEALIFGNVDVVIRTNPQIEPKQPIQLFVGNQT